MVVAETAGLVRIVARGARIDLDLAQQELLAFGDESQIRQVVTNLVLNACQASEPDRGPVVVATGREGRTVYIDVADRGTGIEAETLDRLFTPLASARDGGHGIGLAAAHSIVELHGGEIEVATAPGEGTRFRVRLPAVEE
jgi:signal transduction histidine kinase